MRQITIRPILAVGMHHYGRRELSVGAIYHLEPEPFNKYDKNAVAIYDGPRKVGNLKRENAAAIARVMKLNLAKSKFLLKPIEDSHVKTRKIGTQQLCQITFKAEEESVSSIKTELKSYSCVTISIA